MGFAVQSNWLEFVWLRNFRNKLRNVVLFMQSVITVKLIDDDNQRTSEMFQGDFSFVH